MAELLKGPRPSPAHPCEPLLFFHQLGGSGSNAESWQSPLSLHTALQSQWRGWWEVTVSFQPVWRLTWFWFIPYDSELIQKTADLGWSWRTDTTTRGQPGGDTAPPWVSLAEWQCHHGSAWGGHSINMGQPRGETASPCISLKRSQSLGRAMRS